MAKESFKGKLSMLGNSRTDGARIGYSAIEIGDRTLKGVLCSSFLANYLDRALEHSGDVELEIDLPVGSGTVVIRGLIAVGVGVGLGVFVNGYVGYFLVLVAIGYILVKTAAKYSTVKAITIDGKRYTD